MKQFISIIFVSFIFSLASFLLTMYIQVVLVFIGNHIYLPESNSTYISPKNQDAIKNVK